MRLWGSTPTLRRRPGDRGAVAVEFALVLVPLVMLVFGIITSGLAFGQVIATTNAVREGARFGATLEYDADWSTKVQSRTAELAFGDLNTSDVCVQLVEVGVTIPVAAAPSSCGLSGTAPATPAGQPNGTCVVKVWAERPATINIVVTTWDITISRGAAALYERTC